MLTGCVCPYPAHKPCAGHFQGGYPCVCCLCWRFVWSLACALFLLVFCLAHGVCRTPGRHVRLLGCQLLCTLQLLMGVSETFCGAQLLLEYSC